MMVYNESRDVQYLISPASSLGSILRKTISDQEIIYQKYLNKLLYLYFES